MDNVNSIGILVKFAPDLSGFIQIFPEADDHNVHQTQQRQVKTQPPQEAVEEIRNIKPRDKERRTYSLGLIV